jgi:hypothetical protein
MVNHPSGQSSLQTQLEGRASVRRHNLTHSESALWQYLSGNRLGIAFKRQVPLDWYIVDSLAPSLHLHSRAIALAAPPFASRRFRVAHDARTDPFPRRPNPKTRGSDSQGPNATQQNKNTEPRMSRFGFDPLRGEGGIDYASASASADPIARDDRTRHQCRGTALGRCRPRPGGTGRSGALRQ